jgi:hypothetical protein
MWQDAAAWLLGRLDIDEIKDGQHEPIYWHVLCVPDKTASVVTMSGLQKVSSTAPLNSPAGQRLLAQRIS